jgi:hypothetical protein
MLKVTVSKSILHSDGINQHYMTTTIAPRYIETDINMIQVQLPQFSSLKKIFFFGKKKQRTTNQKNRRED